MWKKKRSSYKAHAVREMTTFNSSLGPVKESISQLRASPNWEQSDYGNKKIRKYIKMMRDGGETGSSNIVLEV